MFIWFAVVSVVLVAIVFRSSGLDYRYVMVGAVLPVGEGLLGGPRLAHSVVGAVALLAIVMAATRGRRLVRRRLLGIPIGVMAHLVLDGSFARVESFWWPLGGLSVPEGQIPEWEHLGVSLVLELVGIAVAFWAWKLFGLDDPQRRDRFVHQGRLDLPQER